MEGDTPILNILRDVTPTADGWVATGLPYSGTSNHVEIVHSDLNAIIHAPSGPFREFSVFFHDELKSFYTRNFDELAIFGQLAGVRDGFAINYGASGMGAMLLANARASARRRIASNVCMKSFSWPPGPTATLPFWKGSRTIPPTCIIPT